MGGDNGLMFSSEKTQVILFHRKNKLKVEGNLHINGSKLTFSGEVSYLGLTLNRRLNWNSLVIKKINEFKGKLGSLRSVLGVRWGPSCRILLWPFESFLLPSLTYGTYGLGSCTTEQDYLDKLRQLNRLVGCLTSSFRRTTPSAGLEVIFGLKPLELVTMEAGLSDSLRRVPKIKWYLRYQGICVDLGTIKAQVGVGNSHSR